MAAGINHFRPMPLDTTLERDATCFTNKVPRPLLLRVVGHLPPMDEATNAGGRCPTSLRGGNRGPGSLGGGALWG